jgi:hypothetical protein
LLSLFLKEPQFNTGLSLLYTKDNELIFGEIYITGKTILSTKEIRKLLPSTGTPFNYNILEKHINLILKFYSNRGFPFAVVKPLNFKSDSISVSFELHINPGNIYRIKSIIFSGNQSAKDEFLFRKLNLELGTIFNEENLNSSIKNLENIDYIYVDSFNLIKVEEEGLISILLFIKEGEIGNLIGGISYSEKGGWSGKFNAVNKNLFGNGRSIKLGVLKEESKYQEENIEYVEPYIFSLPLSLKLNIQHTYIENNSNKTSISAGIFYPIRDFSLSFYSGIENYSKMGERNVVYPFIDLKFLYNANPFNLSYRNKWNRERGWIMEISSKVLIYNFNIYGEYFVLSSNNEELIFFKPIRGYPGIISSEGLKFGIELFAIFDKLMIYPLLEAYWVKDLWQYSYGLGIKVNRVSLEYAIPFSDSPINGLVYITFYGSS